MNIKLIFSLIAFLLLFASCKQTNEQLLDEAYSLSKENKYDKAIEVYNKVIKSNNKLQLAYYNRGLAYLATKQYQKALWDFNKVIALQTNGDYIITYNQDSPFADEEARAQVPYNDALYLRAQVKYYMDSLRSSFKDLQILVENGYTEKCSCLLLQGSIYIRNEKKDKACEYFTKARQIAVSDEERNKVDKMTKTYCE